MRGKRWAALAVLTTACVAAVVVAATVTSSAKSAVANCSLANGVKHVIYLQFDNTHFRRDNPNVASDLEQMPHLLAFMKNNGTLFTNDHTILISHTAGGILSSLTGLYPDRQGQTVSNSYDYFKNNGVPQFRSSFAYWTVPVDGADDSAPNMITDTGKTTPAPWVPYTRAGCDVGGVSTANMVFEANSDVTAVYGAGSPEDLETSAQKTTDFLGYAIHCSQSPGSVCNNAFGAPHAKPDVLPDEPGGYVGYNALFGAKYVNPAITGGNGCVQATDGGNIVGSTGCGFPGFDGALAKNTLGEVEQMQENGVPVTFAYISDAHDNHALGRASGPGEADYKQQLADYDTAFQTFFQNLAAHGIDKSNTLFVVTVDEGDHFAGAQVTPDASGTATYSHVFCPQGTATTPAVNECASNMIGEVNVKIGSVLPAGEPAYDIHFDDAPTFYVDGQPGRTDPSVRKLEHDVWNATAPDPYANSGAGATVPIAQLLADPVEEKTLHMVNADPKRTPTFTMFGNPDFFFQTTNLASGCGGAVVCVNPGFAWNHGNDQTEIGNTWVGFVGPGIESKGIDSTTWTDHTNLRPTINALIGVSDDYTDDGRVLVEALTTKATPQTLIAHRATVQQLGAAYEQVNAPFGAFAQNTLKASTQALASTDETVYNSLESQIATLTGKRDELASKIRAALNAAAFGNQQLNENQAKSWIDQANSLISQSASLAP
jgi:type I phosphodiesterase/nucleotide pyrophosphatase